MNAVEIEQAVSDLAEAPYDSAQFPYQFLEAFGNKPTTINRLRKGESNRSDLVSSNGGGVLQTSNIHLATCPVGEVGATLKALRDSPATRSKKCKFILATDGESIEAENLVDGDSCSCAFADLPNHFGFFLPLAGITTVRQIRENSFDIRATSKLNRLYVELLKENPDWDRAERRQDFNHFMARLIFCFFAEDTHIFIGDALFTHTLEQMTAKDASDTHEVLAEIFRAMDTPQETRAAAQIRPYAITFPYVNGGLFEGCIDGESVPRFSKIARSYLLHVGNLDWKQINPDIFGSMIQAVADDEERGELGMHYTSVPNILKVLNPLFLDDLRAKLEEAADNPRKLLNLRNRMARIRVFDPACGSGNFLVIAYKEMRVIEAEINRRRGEAGRRSDIPLTNFRGIELRHFAAEIARLALIIAEYQCDVLYRGEKLALAEFLPLDAKNWITCDNALRVDWLSVCPPTGTGVKIKSDDLFGTPLDQVEIDFENEGGETFICGNPPYLGKGKKGESHLDEMKAVLGRYTSKYGYVDYVGCWFLKSAEYARVTDAAIALVATNSICQGRQLPQLWPYVLKHGIEIFHAHHSFKWSNSAARNAGVVCVIIGLCKRGQRSAKTITDDLTTRSVNHINAYLIEGEDVYVESVPSPMSDELQRMVTGSVPNDGGNLIFTTDKARELAESNVALTKLIHPFAGSQDFLQGHTRYCLVIRDDEVSLAEAVPEVAQRLQAVASLRSKSKKKETREQLAGVPHRFQHRGPIPERRTLIVPSVSAEHREWFPGGLLAAGTVVSNLAFLIADPPEWHFALIASRIHLVWIATVCGKLKTDYRYSNTLGWNTFPVPPLTDQNKADLTRCAEDILLAREAHWPATIADLYDPDAMPEDLRAAHDRNDETLERIYIGRRFKNDTERLEKLFEMYTEMTAKEASAKPANKTPGRKKKGAAE